jgi:urease alpha subunit
MIQSTDEIPINFGFYAKANSSATKVAEPSLHDLTKELEDQLIAGAVGLRLGECGGVTAASVDSCLRLADFYDVSVILDTDSWRESHDSDLQSVLKNRVAALPITGEIQESVGCSSERLGEVLTHANLINISALGNNWMEEHLHDLGVISVVTSSSFNASSTTQQVIFIYLLKVMLC